MYRCFKTDIVLVPKQITSIKMDARGRNLNKFYEGNMYIVPL